MKEETKSMKRLTLTVLLLSVLLLAGCETQESPPTMLRDYEDRYEDYGYTEVDGEITIGMYMGSEKDIEIPSVIDGKPVTKIGINAFAGSGSIENVVIPEGVRSVEGNAFSNSSLSNITIPKSVTSIEGNPFSMCNELDVITISPDNPAYVSADGMIYSKDMQTLLLCAGGKIGKIQIPNTVQQIGCEAFYYCSRITEVVLPDALTCIGESAFCECTSLTQINLPDQVSTIGEYAFSGCNSLTEINVPASVESIGSFAFSGSTKLQDISVSAENPVFTSAAGILYNKEMTEVICCMPGVDGPVYVPDGVEKIGAHAFDGCQRITSVTLPEGVTEIGSYAFDCVWDLNMITIPDTVTSIGKYAIPSYKNLVIYCKEGSYAETYAVENEIKYTLMK